MAIAYGLIFAVSLIMPPLDFAFIRKKQDEPQLLGLFLCVCVVTFGYFLVSISKTVDFALWVNKITYLGQVFVPMCMFMIIAKLCGYTYKKWVLGVLIGLAIIMYAIIFTTGGLDWYYTSATLAFENGLAYLVKEYGVQHPTNLIYVLVYFVSMLVVCITSLVREKDASKKLAGFMLAIVLGNNDGTLTYLEKLYRTDSLELEFDGWYTEDDDKVTTETVFTEYTILYDRWKPTTLTSDDIISTLEIDTLLLKVGETAGVYDKNSVSITDNRLTVADVSVYEGFNAYRTNKLDSADVLETGKSYLIKIELHAPNGKYIDSQLFSNISTSYGLTANILYSHDNSGIYTTQWTNKENKIQVIINYD